MTTERLQPTKQAWMRARISTILTASDLTAPILLGLAVAKVTTAPVEERLLVSTWVMSAWGAWGITRAGRRGGRFHRSLDAVAVPPLAAMLCVVFLTYAHAPLPLVFLTLVTALWSAVMFSSRQLCSRAYPAMVIGMLPSVRLNSTVSIRDVRCVRLTTPQDSKLQEIDALLTNPSASYGPHWRELFMHANAAGIPILTPAQLDEELTGRVSVGYLHGTRLDDIPFQSSYLPVKHFIDRAVTCLALPALLPLGAIVAVLVLLDSGGPVLFTQQRVGCNGRLFRLYKFRTMRHSSRTQAAFAAQDDVRVTPLGRVLRKYRLDELPQFWNVLRGEMSIIGPRPEQREFVEQFSREIRLYQVRHWVRPGITGWAQINQGYAAGADATTEKLRYDLFYIKHFSFWLDFRIVLQTIHTVLTGFGAR